MARRLQVVTKTQPVPSEFPVARSPQMAACALVQLAAADPRPGAISDAFLVAATTAGGGGTQYALEVAEALARIAAHLAVSGGEPQPLDAGTDGGTA